MPAPSSPAALDALLESAKKAHELKDWVQVLNAQREFYVKLYSQLDSMKQVADDTSKPQAERKLNAEYIVAIKAAEKKFHQFAIKAPSSEVQKHIAKVTSPPLPGFPQWDYELQALNSILPMKAEGLVWDPLGTRGAVKKEIEKTVEATFKGIDKILSEKLKEFTAAALKLRTDSPANILEAQREYLKLRAEYEYMERHYSQRAQAMRDYLVFDDIGMKLGRMVRALPRDVISAERQRQLAAHATVETYAAEATILTTSFAQTSNVAELRAAYMNMQQLQQQFTSLAKTVVGRNLAIRQFNTAVKELDFHLDETLRSLLNHSRDRTPEFVVEEKIRSDRGGMTEVYCAHADASITPETMITKYHRIACLNAFEGRFLVHNTPKESQQGVKSLLDRMDRERASWKSTIKNMDVDVFLKNQLRHTTDGGKNDISILVAEAAAIADYAVAANPTDKSKLINRLKELHKEVMGQMKTLQGTLEFAKTNLALEQIEKIYFAVANRKLIIPAAPVEDKKIVDTTHANPSPPPSRVELKTPASSSREASAIASPTDGRTVSPLPVIPPRKADSVIDISHTPTESKVSHPSRNAQASSAGRTASFVARKESYVANLHDWDIDEKIRNQAGKDLKYLEVKKGDLQFEIHDYEIKTSNNDVNVFKAMMMTFLQSNPGVNLQIATDSVDAAKLWKQAAEDLRKLPEYKDCKALAPDNLDISVKPVPAPKTPTASADDVSISPRPGLGSPS